MVDIFSFNKNYNNFWDPAVLKTYVTKIRKTWKGAYGFSYTYPVPWNGKKTSTIDSTKCHLKCLALVSGNYVWTKAVNTSVRRRVNLQRIAGRGVDSLNVASINGH